MSAAQPGCLHGMLLLYGMCSLPSITRKQVFSLSRCSSNTRASTAFSSLLAQKAPEVFGFQGSSLSYTFDTIIITYMLMPCWDKVCQLTQAPQNYLMPMHEYGVRYDKIHSGHRKYLPSFHFSDSGI